MNWAGCGFGSTGIFGCDSHYRLIARETITLVSGAGFWKGGRGRARVFSSGDTLFRVDLDFTRDVT